MKVELSVLLIAAAVIGMQSFLGSEEAYKYCNPYLLFWLKFLFAGLGGAAMVAKAFMSRSWGDDKDEKAAKEAAEKGSSKVTTTEVTEKTQTVTPATPPSVPPVPATNP